MTGAAESAGRLEHASSECSERSILLLALVFEGGLALVFFLWFAVRHPEEWSWVLHSSHVLTGLVAVVPLWVANWCLLTALRRTPDRFHATRYFLDEIVYPLAAVCSPATAIAVSLLAGVGEELFFRGVLQTEFGLVVASVVFAVVHFGKAVLQFKFLVFVYCLVGLYIGVLFRMTESIWPPIICHAVYDIGVLIYMRLAYRPSRLIPA